AQPQSAAFPAGAPSMTGRGRAPAIDVSAFSMSPSAALMLPPQPVSELFRHRGFTRDAIAASPYRGGFPVERITRFTWERDMPKVRAMAGIFSPAPNAAR